MQCASTYTIHDKLAMHNKKKKNYYKEARPPEAPLGVTFRSDSVGNVGEKQQNSLMIMDCTYFIIMIVSNCSIFLLGNQPTNIYQVRSEGVNLRLLTINVDCKVCHITIA